MVAESALTCADSGAGGAETAGWTHLVARLRASDSSAFEPLINLTRDAGWRLACHMLGDSHLAQDVLQEAYIVVLTRIHTLREPAAFKSWFFQIILNLCRNARRAKGRGPMLGREGDLADVSTCGAGGFEDRVADHLSVDAALAGLTPLERSAILLRDYLQLSYQEMAEVLRVPLGTVKSRLNMARRQLAHRLKGDPGRQQRRRM